MAKKVKFECPVDFGGVNIGNETARVGLTISRANIGIDRMDELFCFRRLAVKLTLGGEANGQGKLIDKDLTLEAVGDTKSYSAKAKNFSTGMTLMLRDVDISTLSKFAKGTGTLLVTSSEALPDEEEEGGEGDEE